MPKQLQKVQHLALTCETHQQIHPEIQNEFSQKGLSDANQIQMSLALEIKSDSEVSASFGKKSIRTKWLREAQYRDFIYQTSLGKIFEGTLLNAEDIHYLLNPLINKTDWLDYVNSCGHDTSGAFILGTQLGSSYILNHLYLPSINKMWALQSLCYVIENQQLKRVLEVLTSKGLHSPLAFLSAHFQNMLTSTNETLKRIGAVALGYILGNVSENIGDYKIDLLLDILSEMLLAYSFCKNKIDSAFAVGRETWSLHVRQRAMQSVLNLAKTRIIPKAFLTDFVISYLDTIEENKLFYFGSCRVQNKKVKKGPRLLFKRVNFFANTGEQEENAVLKGSRLNSGEVEYLYYYATQSKPDIALGHYFMRPQ